MARAAGPAGVEEPDVPAAVHQFAGDDPPRLLRVVAESRDHPDARLTRIEDVELGDRQAERGIGVHPEPAGVSGEALEEDGDVDEIVQRVLSGHGQYHRSAVAAVADHLEAARYEGASEVQQEAHLPIGLAALAADHLAVDDVATPGRRSHVPVLALHDEAHLVVLEEPISRLRLGGGTSQDVLCPDLADARATAFGGDEGREVDAGAVEDLAEGLGLPSASASIRRAGAQHAKGDEGHEGEGRSRASHGLTVPQNPVRREVGPRSPPGEAEGGALPLPGRGRRA